MIEFKEDFITLPIKIQFATLLYHISQGSHTNYN